MISGACLWNLDLMLQIQDQAGREARWLWMWLWFSLTVSSEALSWENLGELALAMPGGRLLCCSARRFSWVVRPVVQACNQGECSPRQGALQETASARTASSSCGCSLYQFD